MIADSSIAQFEERLGYRFTRRDMLERALTHKSFSHEARDRMIGDNETFEFLGDSVLGFVIGDMIFARFPEFDEGVMSKMKAFLVSAPALARKAKELDMGSVLFLGVGEEKTGGRSKDSLLANVFEALIAAIYLDGGIEAVRGMIERTFQEDFAAIDGNDLLFHDYKTALQELAQSKGLALPDYTVIEEIGPDHDKRFVVEVRLGQNVVGRGEGSSKKEAQQQAAKVALAAEASRQEEERSDARSSSPAGER